MTNGYKVYEGIKEKETKRERGSALHPRCARAWSGAAWEISFMSWKKKSSGTDSIQLFSIKPFMASIKYSAAGLLVYTMC